MTVTKTITLSMLALAIFSNVYGARYDVTNSGSDSITVKIDLWEVEEYANKPVSTPLTIDNLKPGTKPFGIGAGGGKAIRAVYLLKPASGQLIPLSGHNTKSGKFESNAGVKGDQAIEFTSVNGQWFIHMHSK